MLRGRIEQAGRTGLRLVEGGGSAMGGRSWILHSTLSAGRGSYSRSRLFLQASNALFGILEPGSRTTTSSPMKTPLETASPFVQAPVLCNPSKKNI